MKMIRIFLLLLVFLLISTNAQALENSKNLYLKAGSSYLILFDDRITGCEYDNKIISIENLSSILSNNQQIIVKPLKVVDSKLVVITSAGEYIFNITKESDNPLIIELENPPGYTNKSVNPDFEIDSPPELKKK